MEMVTNLVAALEQATLMAKQLPTTTDPPQILQIYSTLNAAHHHLSSFLSLTTPPPPQPSLLTPHTAADNSFSSAAGNDQENSPMDEGEEIEAEQNSIERVEERMRNCFIQSKRRKRSLSPSTVARERRRREYERDFVREQPEFDPNANRLRALDLIYQFHC